jgi:hypothetical protein
MMNRILKRPMFRMGGRSDDGIMSIRRGYAEGDSVRDSIEEEIYPSSLLGVTNRVLGNVNDALFNYGARPLANIAQFITKTNPEYIEPKDSKEEMIDLILKNRRINLDADGETTATDTSGNDLPPSLRGKKTDTTNSTNNETGEQSDQELIKSYMDMFSEAMGESEEDVSRQRYLELAKFGANLLGQPGGDLVGSIGRAAAPSIQGLAEGAARKSAANREIKLAGLKTAIAQMDDPTADKIKTLARLSGVSEKEVAKLMLDTDGDSSLDRIELTAKAIEGDVGSSAALSIAQALEEEGAVLAQARPVEIDKKTKKPKEGVGDGYYYDEKGILYKVEKGKPSVIKIK